MPNAPDAMPTPPPDAVARAFLPTTTAEGRTELLASLDEHDAAELLAQHRGAHRRAHNGAAPRDEVERYWRAVESIDRERVRVAELRDAEREH